MKIAKSESIIGCVDIGTSKISVLIGLKEGEDPIQIIGAASKSSGKSVKKGDVIDINMVADILKDVLSEAERMADIELSSVFVNISGSNIKSDNNKGQTTINGNGVMINEEDLNKVLDSAEAVHLPPSYEILHFLPGQYIVDGKKGIKNPVNMFGVKLEASVHMVMAHTPSLHNLAHILNRCNVACENIVASPVASAYSCLTEEQKENGVILLDIGAGTTDVTVFSEGSPVYTDVIPVAGNQITKDISIVLKIHDTLAEQLKKEYGSALRSNIGLADEFIVPAMLNKPSAKMPLQQLVSIIEARVEELFQIIKKKIQDKCLSDDVGYGVVITGGSSKLKDIDALAEKVFNMPAKIAILSGVDGLDHILGSPVYAVSVGMLKYGYEDLENNPDTKIKGKKIFHLIIDWMRNLFHK